MVMAAWSSQMLRSAEDIKGTLVKISLLNCCQILRLIRIVIFVELSRIATRCQAKLLTSSPQIVLKKFYLSILVNDEF